MATNRDFTLVPHHPFERPTWVIARSGMIALIVAATLAWSNVLYGNRPWSDHISGYLLVGGGVMSLGWGLDRLWYSTVALMIPKPFSFAGYISRLPFWYFSGAIGYVLGLLTAKKLNLLTVYDIPVKSLFFFGGNIGILIQILLHLWLYKIFVQRIYDTSRAT